MKTTPDTWENLQPEKKKQKKKNGMPVSIFFRADQDLHAKEKMNS